MKKFTQKFASYIMVFLMGLGLVAPALAAAPTYATAGNSAPTTFGAEAAILTGCAQQGNDGSGGGVACIVILVVDILSVLIGIVGVIGIVIVGIQYLTAGGNEEQVRKAKRRLFEIVLGLALYAVAYLFAKWLLPNFDNSNNGGSSPVSSAIPYLIAAIGV